MGIEHIPVNEMWKETSWSCTFTLKCCVHQMLISPISTTSVHYPCISLIKAPPLVLLSRATSRENDHEIWSLYKTDMVNMLEQSWLFIHQADTELDYHSFAVVSQLKEGKANIHSPFSSYLVTTDWLLRDISDSLATRCSTMFTS